MKPSLFVACAATVSLLAAPLVVADIANAAVPFDMVYRTPAQGGAVTHTSWGFPTSVTLPSDGQRVDVRVVGGDGGSTTDAGVGGGLREGGRGATVTGYFTARGQKITLNGSLSEGGNGGASTRGNVGEPVPGGNGGNSAGLIIQEWDGPTGGLPGSYAAVVAGGGGGSGAGSTFPTYRGFCEGGLGGNAGTGAVSGGRYFAGVSGSDRPGYSHSVSGIETTVCSPALGGQPNLPVPPLNESTNGGEGEQGRFAQSIVKHDIAGGGGGGGGGVSGGSGGSSGGSGGAGGGSFVGAELSGAVLGLNPAGATSSSYARVSWTELSPTVLTVEAAVPPIQHILSQPAWIHGSPLAFDVKVGIPANVSDADVNAGGVLSFSVNGESRGSVALGTVPEITLPMQKNLICFSFDPAAESMRSSPEECIEMLNMSPDTRATVGLDIADFAGGQLNYAGAACDEGCYTLPHGFGGQMLGLRVHSANPATLLAGVHPMPSGSEALVKMTNLPSGDTSNTTVTVSARDGRTFAGRSFPGMSFDPLKPGVYELQISAFTRGFESYLGDTIATDPVRVRILKHPTSLEVAEPASAPRGTPFTIPVTGRAEKPTLVIPGGPFTNLPSPEPLTGALVATVSRVGGSGSVGTITTEPLAADPMLSGSWESGGSVTVAGDLAPGRYELRIMYGGTDVYDYSSTSTFLTVTDGPSVTTLAGPGTLVYGQNGEFVATPQSDLGAVVNAGSVSFTATSGVGSSPIDLGTSAIVSGTASLNLASDRLLRAGDYEITANFLGGDGRLPSASVPKALTVTPAGTTLAASPERRLSGSPELRVAVTVLSPSGATPDGKVVARLGTVSLGELTLVDGTATLPADRSSAPIVADLDTAVELSYSGSDRFSAATPVRLAFGPAETLISAASPAAAPRGSAIEVPLQVHAQGSTGAEITGEVVRALLHADPLGEVTGTVWRDGSKVDEASVAISALSGITAPVGVPAASAGIATVSGDLQKGEYELRFAYAGSSHFNASQLAVPFDVKPGPSSVTHAAPPALVYGEMGEFSTFPKSALGAGAESGLVTFWAKPNDSSAIELGSVSVTGGTAALRPGAAKSATVRPGSYQVWAEFDGGDGLLASISEPTELVVTKAASALKASIGFIGMGGPRLVVGVAAAAPSRATPDGVVTLTLDGAVFATLPLESGRAELLLPRRATPGDIVVSYDGTELFEAAEPVVLVIQATPVDSEKPTGTVQGAGTAQAKGASGTNGFAQSGADLSEMAALAALLLGSGLLLLWRRRSRLD